jgi:hypothetical protein
MDTAAAESVVYGFSATSWLVGYLVVWLPFWPVFTKAGRAGWEAIVPIYNLFVMLQIVGRSGWWLIALFIPLVNVFVWILILYDLADSFGHGVGYALGLLLLPFVFALVIGLGSSQYGGPAALRRPTTHRDTPA